MSKNRDTELTVTVDFRQFDRAVLEYSQVYKGDFAQATNRCALNLAIQCIKKTKEATAAAIEKLQHVTNRGGEEWWPKYIAKILKGRAAARVLTRMMRAKTKRGQRNAEASFGRSGYYTRAQAQAFSAKLIRGRLKAIGFIRFFFLSMARAIQPSVKGLTVPAGKAFAGFSSVVKVATHSDPTVSVKTFYSYKVRSMKTARKAERLLQQWLADGIPLAVADVKAYTERKLAEAGKRFSGRPA